MGKKSFSGKIYKYLLMAAIILLAELFVFNYRHWESLGNREVTMEALDGQVTLGRGYQQVGDHIYLVTGDELDILLEGIERELRTSCIKIQVLYFEDEKEKPIIIHQEVTDESHRLYYGLPERELWAGEERSAYMTYHLYGKCENLKITPQLSVGMQIFLSVSLNPVIPLFFSWERVLILFFLVCLVCILKPSSILHQLPYLGREGKARYALLIFYFILHSMLFFRLTSLNPNFQQEIGENQKQYQKLAESLKEGKFFIMEEPSKTLKSMDNPYDFAYRNRLMEETGEWYQWDYAYYEGKYYVYFGIVPAVLFYLPFYLLTGRHLPNHTLVFLLSLLFLSGVLGVLHELIRKWFPKISLASWLLITELFLTGSNIIYMTKRPDLYTVPILSGLSFGLLGFWCFLRGMRGEKFSYGYIALGSLLTAGIAGCRPQLFVFIFPALFLLAKHAILNCTENRLTGGKTSVYLKLSFSFAIPMLLAGIVLMYYNYSRFGNIFDFGANYNLTFNDMRRRGFQFDRIPLGVFAYLLQPVKVIQQFPFADAVYFDSQYMGVTIQEATYGGLFTSNFFALFSILPVFFSRQFKKYNCTAWKMSLLMLLSAMAVIVADTNMSGILMRYFSDFSVFFMLTSAVSSFILMEHFGIGCAERTKSGQFSGLAEGIGREIIWILLLSLLWGRFYQSMTFFLDTGEALRDLRPDLYSHVKYLTAFWL